MAPVLARQFCRLQSSRAANLPQGSLPPGVLTQRISTPLQADAWERALADHPQPDWVHALLRGMRSGFRIGLQTSAQCRSAARPRPSAQGHSRVVDEFLRHQVAAGYMMGPFDPQECSGVVTSSIGVVPKSTPGKFRVIVDLSRPEGASVNDQLHRELTHVAYSSIEDASLAMHALGQGAQLAKIDIRDAYRIIPVHPEERPFLALSWEGRVYIDCQLPFGLASAPAIFSAVAEALEWVLRRRGVRGVLHYLDDFLLLGAPGSLECSHALAITFATCEELGVPLAMDKVEGPAVSLTFLGIHLSSSPPSVSLPREKIRALQGLLQEFLSTRCVRDMQALESLVGHLVHATKVCPLAKPFLGGLFQVLRGCRPGQPRRLNVATRADLAWWHSLLSSWPGISTHQFLVLGQPDRHLYTDASGSWGCGAWSLPAWLQVPWPTGHCLTSIALKELVPVVLAVAVWAEHWRGQFILCHSDNTAVVAQLNSLHARDPLACNMLRCLAFLQALHDFRLRAVHIAGALNTGADRLSRNDASAFLGRYSCASPSPSQVCPELVRLLCLEPADWTSLHWRERFTSFWRQAYPTPPGGCTGLGGTASSPSQGLFPSLPPP